MQKLVLSFFLLLAMSNAVFSQTINNAPNGKSLLKMTQAKISFQKPDTTFSALIDDNGYESAALKAKVVSIIIPASFEGARKSIQKGERTNVFGTVTYVFIDSSTVKTNGKEMLWIVSKIISPDTLQYAHYIMIQSFLKVPNEEYCISLNAVYPKSKDSLALRQKFIASFLAAKEED